MTATCMQPRGSTRRPAAHSAGSTQRSVSRPGRPASSAPPAGRQRGGRVAVQMHGVPLVQPVLEQLDRGLRGSRGAGRQAGGGSGQATSVPCCRPSRELQRSLPPPTPGAAPCPPALTLLPTSSADVRGRYFSTHSSEPPLPIAGLAAAGPGPPAGLAPAPGAARAGPASCFTAAAAAGCCAACSCCTGAGAAAGASSSMPSAAPAGAGAARTRLNSPSSSMIFTCFSCGVHGWRGRYCRRLGWRAVGRKGREPGVRRRRWVHAAHAAQETTPASLHPAGPAPTTPFHPPPALAPWPPTPWTAPPSCRPPGTRCARSQSR